AVRSDHADDAAGRQLEGEIVDQEPVAEALGEAVDLHHHAAQPRTGRNPDLRLADLLAPGLLGQLLVGLNARLGLRLPRLGRGPDPLQLALQGALLGLLLTL